MQLIAILGQRIVLHTPQKCSLYLCFYIHLNVLDLCLHSWSIQNTNGGHYKNNVFREDGISLFKRKWAQWCFGINIASRLGDIGLYLTIPLRRWKVALRALHWKSPLFPPVYLVCGPIEAGGCNLQRYIIVKIMEFTRPGKRLGAFTG